SRSPPRMRERGRKVERNRATSGSRPLRTWLGGTAAAEPTPSPEEDEGDGGDDDRERDGRRAAIRSREAEHVRIDADRDRGRDVVACVVRRPDPDAVVSVREDELLRGR